MTYVDRDELIIEIKTTELRSYFNLGLLDDADLYPIIDVCLSLLKCKTKAFKSKVLQVQNFKAKLPEDFFKLTFIVKCNSYALSLRDNLASTRVDYVPVVNPIDHSCNLRKCQTPFMSCSGDKYYLDQVFEYTDLRLNEVEPIRIVKTNKDSAELLNHFGNSRGGTGTISDGYLHLEERDVPVYIEYESTENEGLVPDVPKIRKAIKDILVYNAFKIMFNNGEQEVQARMQYNEKFASIAEDILRLYAKGNEVKEFLDLHKRFTQRYNALASMSHVNYNKYQTNGNTNNYYKY